MEGKCLFDVVGSGWKPSGGDKNSDKLRLQPGYAEDSISDLSAPPTLLAASLGPLHPRGGPNKVAYEFTQYVVE